MNETTLIKCTEIQANVAAALIEMEAMKIANLERERQGLAYAYNENAFFNLIAMYDLSSNRTIEKLYHN